MTAITFGLIDGLICSANQFGRITSIWPEGGHPRTDRDLFWRAFYLGACDGLTDLLGHGASMVSGFYESQLGQFLEGEEKQRYVTEFRQALERKARAKARLDWQQHQRKNGECA